MNYFAVLLITLRCMEEEVRIGRGGKGVSRRGVLYKCYDIRGLYPEEVNEDAAKRIGSAIVHFLKQQKGTIKNIVVGRDMQDSSTPLAQALIEGITAAGVNVTDIGVVSTDVTYFAVAQYGYRGRR